MPAKLGMTEGSFRYGRRLILDCLSFGVEAGEILCVLGSNGCGKTTLLRCLRGFLELETGRCCLDGVDIRSMTASALARRIGFVFQDQSVPFPYTVLEMVKMGRAPYLRALSSPSRRDGEIADAALETVGISHLRDRKVTTVSGGERQLAAIARTLAQQPDVIIMDEPTSALDFRNQVTILRIIDRLARDGMAIVLSTHFPNHVMQRSCTAALMMDGRFIALGPAGEVMTEGSLRETYGMDVRIVSVDDPAMGGRLRFCIAAGEAVGEGTPC